MGEHLPCKQGVESSNLFISIGREICQNLYLENCIYERSLKETLSYLGEGTVVQCTYLGNAQIGRHR